MPQVQNTPVGPLRQIWRDVAEVLYFVGGFWEVPGGVNLAIVEIVKNGEIVIDVIFPFRKYKLLFLFVSWEYIYPS